MATRRSRGLQPHAAAGEVGSVRADRRGRVRTDPRPADAPRSTGSSTGRRRSRPTTTSSSARPRCADCSSPPGSARTGSPAPPVSAGGRPSGSSRASRRWTCAKMDVRRFGAHYRSRAYALARAVEIYSTHYDVKYPGEECQAGRPLRMSPTYPRLQALGAVFGEKSGWERANWFASNEDERYEELRPAAGRESTGRPRSRPSTWRRASAPACSTRRASRRSRCRVPARAGSSSGSARATSIGPTGTVVYTQMLNRRGGIEADVTVTRLAEDRFRIVTGTGSGTHDLAWLGRQLDDAPGVEIRDATSSLACLGLWGPAARDDRGRGLRRRPVERRLPVHDRS